MQVTPGSEKAYVIGQVRDIFDCLVYEQLIVIGSVVLNYQRIVAKVFIFY